PISNKEAIATAISRINDCPFCVGAHAFLANVAGSKDDGEVLATGAPTGIADRYRRDLAQWAAATRRPGDELLQRVPFSEAEAPEVIGTAVGFHYINRVVEVL